MSLKTEGDAAETAGADIAGAGKTASTLGNGKVEASDLVEIVTNAGRVLRVFRRIAAVYREKQKRRQQVVDSGQKPVVEESFVAEVRG